LVLVSPNIYFSLTASLARLSDSVTIIQIEEGYLSDSHILQLYKKLVGSGAVTSNHPPTELHCLARWVLLDKYLPRTEVSGGIVCLDWDTLCLNKHSSLIDGLSKKTPLIYSMEADRSRYPLYSICPNHIVIFDPIVLQKYLSYTYQQMLLIDYMHSLNNSTFYFSDMLPWSSVVSYLNLANREPFKWQLLLAQTDFIFEHNIRIKTEHNDTFIMEEFSLSDCNCNYTGHESISIKRLFNISGQIYLCLANKGTFTLRKPISIHLSGTETKWLYFNKLRREISNSVGL
jgi:hypothetical protein